MLCVLLEKTVNHMIADIVSAAQRTVGRAVGAPTIMAHKEVVRFQHGTQGSYHLQSVYSGDDSGLHGQSAVDFLHNVPHSTVCYPIKV